MAGSSPALIIFIICVGCSCLFALIAAILFFTNTACDWFDGASWAGISCEVAPSPESPAESPADSCAGLTDTSPASKVPVNCITKIWADKGCTNTSFIPADGGWWHLDTGATTYKGIKDDMTIYGNADAASANRIQACRGPLFDAGKPCAGLSLSTPASRVPDACLQDTWKSVGCTNTAYIPNNYTGWWKNDTGAVNMSGIIGDMRFYATSDDQFRKTACGRT